MDSSAAALASSTQHPAATIGPRICESEAELIEKGLVPPRRGKDNSDLLFAVPNSGADGETLFSLADYETCLADDVCEVSDEIVDKAYGAISAF